MTDLRGPRPDRGSDANVRERAGPTLRLIDEAAREHQSHEQLVRALQRILESAYTGEVAVDRIVAEHARVVLRQKFNRPKPE